MKIRFRNWLRQLGSVVLVVAQILVAASAAENSPRTAADGTAGNRSDAGSLIATLDAPQFRSRDEASQRLAEQGPAVIPVLIEALGDPSAEVRFRATLLLSRRHSFEEVAFPLINATNAPYASRVRLVLRERTLQQLEAICQMPYAEKLFRFWGTDLETYCNQSLTRLNDATNLEQTRQAVAPLVGLEQKSKRFDAAVSELEALSLSYDHQYSPGFVIADTLARGLKSDHTQWVAFAERHLASLQRLAASMRAKNESKYAIHKEVLDRANMSQGAAGFLVSILDDTSPVRQVLAQRIGIPPDELQTSFCEGLAHPDSHTCDCGVGKVHVVDMLVESLTRSPDPLDTEICQTLVNAIANAARTGNKPKALALLDALEACKDLRAHKLQLDQGLGRQLAQRLADSALAAPNNRTFHPTQSVHTKLIALWDLEITPNHPMFPQKLFEQYLAGAEQVTTDDGRLALERYVRVLERLHTGGVNLQDPATQDFVRVLRDGLPNQSDLLAAGVTHLDQVLRNAKSTTGKADANYVANALNDWLKNRDARR